MAGKFTRILSLKDEQILAVNNQLATGASAQSVARLIQQDWKEFQDVAEKTLTQQLLRYKSEMIESPKIAQQLALPADHPIAVAGEKRMEVLEEMIELARLHKKRIQGFVEREGTLKMPIKGTSEDIRLLGDLLKDVQKLQFDLGVDVYQGPVIQGGKVTQSRTTLPDGTTIDSQTTEAVQGALDLLQQRRDKALEGEFSVVAAPSEPD